MGTRRVSTQEPGGNSSQGNRAVRECEGSFDCVSPSLCEADISLRMKGRSEILGEHVADAADLGADGF